MKNNEEN